MIQYRKIRKRRFNGAPSKRITAIVRMDTYRKLISGGISLGWAIDKLAGTIDAYSEETAKTS